MAQSDSGERFVQQQYAWATPDDRALRILAHHSPLLEIGCGTNAYWCWQLMEWSAQLQDGGVDIVGVDVAPRSGGKITTPSSEGLEAPTAQEHDFPIVACLTTTTILLHLFHAFAPLRTVVHPNLSASSLQKLRNKQHTRRPSIGQDGTTEPFVVDRNEREYSEDVPCNIQYQKNTSTLLLLDL